MFGLRYKRRSNEVKEGNRWSVFMGLINVWSDSRREKRVNCLDKDEIELKLSVLIRVKYQKPTRRKRKVKKFTGLD